MVCIPDSDRQARVVSLLEDSVRTELRVTNGMLELGLSEGDIERLMEGVTSGLLLLGAVLAARSRLPKWITVPTWVLLVATLVPMTSWLAALLVPVWLGVEGALARRG